MNISPQASQGPIRLHINLTQNDTSLGGQVTISVIIRNIAENPVFINHRQVVNYPSSPPGQGDLTVILIGPEGYRNYKKRAVNPKRLSDEHWRKLEPGQSLSKEIKLNKYYDLNMPGVYKIQVGFDNRRANLSNIKKRALIYSNVLEINIEEKSLKTD